ncbi:MAG: MOSC domain-containing protein [Gemmatimonadaceae bacterium]|nr:MOSC domain-containing protein [Gemmatimonadaceae bacterium]
MTGRTGKVASINSSGGGVPKRPVLFSNVNTLGLEADRHVSKDHGGPDRAICIYSLDLIKALRAEGHPIDVGTAGENLTVEGLDWALMRPGAILTVGAEVRLEITSFTPPCKTIKASFLEGNFVRISEKVHPGWSRVYARILTPGEVKAYCSIVIE